MAETNFLKPWWIVIIILPFILALMGSLRPAEIAQAEDKSPPLMAPLASEPVAIIAQTGEQTNPALAFNPLAQNFLVVWEDASTSKPSIWGRMVDVHGTPLYGAFPISSDTTYGRHKPDVVYNANNNEFLVVYEFDWTAEDVDIRSRRVSSTGVPAVLEGIVAQSEDKEKEPSVVHNTTDNNYLVAWQRWVGNVEFGTYDIHGVLLTSSAEILGNLIEIKTDDEYNQVTPTAAYFTALHQYSVMWVDYYGMNYPRIFEQRIEWNGVKSGSEINITAFGANYNPNMVYNPLENQYAFVFENKVYDDPERTMYGYVYLWEIGTAGYGGPINWEIESPYDEYQPDIAYNPIGHNYVIVWEREWTQADHDIYMEQYEMISSHFCCWRHLYQGVSRLSSWEGNPAVASSDGPGNLVVWEDGRNAGNGMDIYGAVISVSKNFIPMVYR